MILDHLQTMLQYNRWANGLVLEKAGQATPEEYNAPVPGLSFGSLHGTLVHALIAEVVWLARWRGEQPPEHLRDARASNQIAAEHVTSFDALASLWRDEDVELAGFIEGLSEERVEGTVAYRTQYGEPNEQPLHELIGHFVNHGTQFRSEAAIRLSQLGLSPGDLDLIIYLRQRQG